MAELRDHVKPLFALAQRMYPSVKSLRINFVVAHLHKAAETLGYTNPATAVKGVMEMFPEDFEQETTPEPAA